MAGIGFDVGPLIVLCSMQSPRFLFASFFDAVHQLGVHAIVAASVVPAEITVETKLEFLRMKTA
jgi:hypothetical protein